MSNVYTSLADLVKLNDLNARDLGVTDLLNKAPFLKVIHSTTSSNGTSHKYIKESTAPTVGFRALNTGRFVGQTGYTEVTVTLANMDASVIADKALADAYTKGGAGGFNARESQNAIQQAFFAFEQQIWYGTGLADASGFAGLGDNALYNTITGTVTGAAATVVNAAGTTASTASSIWLVSSTADERGVSAVIGNSGSIDIGETVVTLKADDTTPAKSYPAYLTPIQSYLGLQIGSIYSVVRICNITADSGKGATDALIASAINLFPSYAPPTHIVMNRRSLGQLQKSRTATNPTGAPAPYPANAFDIPVVVTDSITSTEALLT